MNRATKYPDIRLDMCPLLSRPPLGIYLHTCRYTYLYHMYFICTHIYTTHVETCVQIYIQSLYFPDVLAVLLTLWHRLDSKSMVLYAYFCSVSLTGKDKRSVHQAVLEDINNYSSTHIIRIHTWSRRQVRKLTEAFFSKYLWVCKPFSSCLEFESSGFHILIKIYERDKHHSD